LSSVFACGSDVKNRFSFFQEGEFCFSPDNGDLADPDNYSRYIQAIKNISAEQGFSPDIIAYDLHPGYFSSKIDNLFPGNSLKIAVQHHHAHIASVLCREKYDQSVIGISFDGTGYGLDGNLWGGEFLLVSPKQCERKAHFDYLGMPGGEKAILEPWRMAFSLAYSCLGEEVFKENFAFLKVRANGEYALLQKVIKQRLNMPLTSSAGRLFDAVSSLLDITHIVNFEAEAAINLEQKAGLSDDQGCYDFEVEKELNMFKIGYKTLWHSLIADIKAKVEVAIIARRFHNSLAKLIVVVSEKIKLETGVNTVVLSGGVFQNKLLYVKALKDLKAAGFKVLEAPKVPLNDLGICIGQTYVALNKTV